MRADEKPSIVWFRRDLRMEDHRALHGAVRRGAPVIPVFVASPNGDLPSGRGSRWWLHRSLRSLAESLEAAGSRLIFRQGEADHALAELIAETGATAVFMSRRYEPDVARRDRRLIAALAPVDVVGFGDSLLFDPTKIRNGTGDPYRVFTPFWNRLLALPDPGIHLPKPKRIPAPEVWPRSIPLDELRREMRDEDTQELRSYWHPGERGALEMLAKFVNKGIHDYERRRDYPGEGGTSRLSPHLHFGEISPRRVWYEVGRTGAGDTIRMPFLRQLAWREFSYYVLHHFPESIRAPLRESFEQFPWRDDRPGLEAWTRGRTGYPLVDAGMRELAETGWMHNRIRMVTASFLVKHLMVHWLEGAAWFMETLVDADVANNTMGWQWTAGCGADAAPFFRVFNPVLQGSRFDPRGRYVRKWVPELGALPDRHIHKPWAAPGAVLSEARVEIGRNYPGPIVDHTFARARALTAYRTLGTRTQKSTRRGDK